MPIPGLSLVGFMDQASAINYLRGACICNDNSDSALTAEWQIAKNRLGAPLARAGTPDIQPIPPSHQPYIQQITTQQWCADLFAGPWQNCEFKLIEIDPLLAYQFNVMTGRSNDHCNGLSSPPTLDELMALCLPHAPQSENFQTFTSPNSMILKAPLNLRSFGGGVFNAAFMGLQFGVALPFAHVVRYNGRCYLHNGFHRAVGLRSTGATHIPCVLRDVNNHQEVGILPNGATFSAALLESANPPTVGHFTQGRAYDVVLRRVARFLHVSWAEYVLPEE